jgi:glycosyltransferase involved in cell wall biosynthesis
MVALSSYTGLGGGETILLSLLASLDRSRIVPSLVAPREGQLTEAARSLNVEVRIVPFRGASLWFVPAVWARLPPAEAIAKQLRDLDADVAYADFHTLPYAAAACRDAGVPLIFICHGWWFRPKLWQRRLFRDGVDAVVAVSDAVKRGFLGTPPFMPPERVVTLHPGVDILRFRLRRGERGPLRRAYDLPVAPPLITMVARFQHVKGHDVFLAAARLIARRHPDARFAIAGENVFGGGADSRYKRRIVAMATDDAVLRERVTFLGWIDDVECLYAASDIVVCSSRFESYGVAALEAMACGVPVVSTNVGGPAETIADGVTGFLVPPDRPDLIASRVSDLLDDAERRRTMGDAARSHVVERFPLDKYTAAVQDLVLRTARKPGGTAPDRHR